ncbi:putative acetyltransferase/hydrolase [Vibrio nigripulchritudo MADA3029]|uniref:Putative acetyltransferase/hydrolase n=1 Tax=Vibrio nigripulchritudo TaxID=28173 RepID=U4KB03_9VIBR|nr:MULTISPECIES: acetyltransferase/hydrolase [Vibrio]UAB73351.1 triacylglycerol lipase [Vibrio sp. SCSIO 43132]CCN33904.1 putative acetyltransferase/hydrolase [Vibrio nigripulchritudo AM115]CCN43776.1 putative acetyltransferase/hydrolase [Vibrio nigripulchritudo FTn2]CCN49117.1 putative acetyltransferase/hydrolase [Vibrio nigripulchritudo MADA3020]CCN56271.1 putative acetyltransferase/hydrolase [Vibrio nigripulchritudo MADA3021]
MKIIILHGLYMHGVVMQPLSQRLKTLGYDTQVISYNSVSIDEDKLFASIDSAIDESEINVLVGHSLGGVVIKNYLASRRPSSNLISHVIAVGSPLKGASIICRIQELGLGAVLGNAPEFGLKKHHDVWSHPQKLGSIAGTIPLGMRPLLLMDNDTLSDGTVTVEETKIDGMTDHLETKSSHTSMIYSQYIPNQIDHFIRQDQFRHIH